MTIPTIDLSPANPHASTQLLDAATKHGFVFIENNSVGIPPASIENLFQLSQKFFASPLEIKQEVAIGSNEAGKNHGWLSRGIEMLDPATQKRADVKEALNIGAPSPTTLPLPLRPHTQELLTFQTACQTLCTTILSHLALALGLEKSWFTARHDRTLGPSGTVLRLLYYPHVEGAARDQDDVRAGAHSDFGSLTLLFRRRGEGGLEIRGMGGKWVDVPVDPVGMGGEEGGEGRALPILVNIGDLLEDWTGGLLKSTVHRVVFPRGMTAEEEGEGSDRYSIAYFCHPLDDATLDAVPSAMVQEYARRTGKGSVRDGRVMTAKDHLMERLAATYHLK